MSYRCLIEVVPVSQRVSKIVMDLFLLDWMDDMPTELDQQNNLTICHRVIMVKVQASFESLCVLLLVSASSTLSLSRPVEHRISRRQWLRVLPALPSTLLWHRQEDDSRANAAIVDEPTAFKRPLGPSLAPEYFQSPIDTAPSAGRSYFPTLTPPFQNRATFRYTVGRNTWALEQLLTFVNVTASIRCHVVKLQSTGGLWVHSPQWPTGELCHLLNDLGAPVQHIVLPCNALEHKAPMKAFVQRYPEASVWISPGQYGPFGSCGQTQKDPMTMGYRVDGVLGSPEMALEPPPWANEFDMATLYLDLPKNAGPVSEVAFCHRPTKTLIATDAVVYIPNTDTARLDLFETYFAPKVVQDDPTFWPRTVLQAVFLPLRTDQDNPMRYPGYEAIRERLIRAPILRAFVDARAPIQVQEWTNQIAQWDFDRILTSHFASPIWATPREFVQAFAYLSSSSESHSDDDDNRSTLPPIACQDWELLQNLNTVISDYNLGEPAIFDYQRGCVETN